MISRLFPPPPDYPADNLDVFRRNIRYHLIDGSMYVFGMSLVSVQTILPVFIKELGGSPIAIGSVQVLWTLGQNLPSIIIAHYIRRQVLYSPAMISWGLAHRVMLLVCGLSIMLLSNHLQSTLIVPLFLLFIFLIPVIGSVSGLPWFQVFTKTVPVRLRGRLFGFRILFGSAGGAVGGSIVGVVLYTVGFPSNFALLFILAFIGTMISFYYLTKISEPKSIRSDDTEPALNIIADIRAILLKDKNFRRFLLADMAMIMSLSAMSFYAVYALDKFSLPPSYAGTFTGIVMITNIGATILFGYVADTYGHKLNLQLFGVCGALAGIIAVVSTNILIYGFVFFFLACAVQAQAISRLSLIAEMSSENDRPTYIGILNTLTAPTIIAGLLFGWLIPVIGFESIFLITALLAAISFLILHRYVQDPRTI